MASILKGIQEGVSNRLTADPFFSTDGVVTVITENIGDINNAIQTALAKLGVCAIIITPTANAAFPDYLVPYFDKISILVRVVENVVLNRSSSGTGKTASEVAEKVAALLHQYAPAGISENIFLDNPSITIANAGDNKGLLAYDVRLRTAGGFTYSIDQVETPVISFSNGTMRISCATPGAAIYYTTDGSSPSPGNPKANLWLGYSITGVVDLEVGHDSGSISGLGLPWVPTSVTMTVSGSGDDIFWAVVDGPVTGDGWAYALQGAPTTVGYRLNWSAASSLSTVIAQSGTRIRAQGWLAGMLTSAEAISDVSINEGLGFPTLPSFVSGGQMVPTVDDSGSIIAWPFRDQTTGSIVYVRVVDGAFQLSES